MMLEHFVSAISPNYQDPAHLAKLCRQFETHSYVRLPNFFTPDIMSSIRDEVSRLERVKVRKNFVMPGYNTPRVMHTIGGRGIREQSALLPELYAREELHTALRNLSGSVINSCEHPNEFMVINYLQDFGGTHGWHLDDPPFALVLILEAPPPQCGGLLEYVPDYHKLVGDFDISRTSEFVERARIRGQIKCEYHASGDAYLLRADTCLHRVTLLQSSTLRRVVINMAFEGPRRTLYGPTASLLYDATPNPSRFLSETETSRPTC